MKDQRSSWHPMKPNPSLVRVSYQSVAAVPLLQDTTAQLAHAEGQVIIHLCMSAKPSLCPVEAHLIKNVSSGA
jgi:hypothetical protein